MAKRVFEYKSEDDLKRVVSGTITGKTARLFDAIPDELNRSQRMELAMLDYIAKINNSKNLKP